MSIKTTPRSILPSKKGDCPECGGFGVTGMYQDRCNSCDGTGMTSAQLFNVKFDESMRLQNEYEQTDEYLQKKHESAMLFMSRKKKA